MHNGTKPTWVFMMLLLVLMVTTCAAWPLRMQDREDDVRGLLKYLFGKRACPQWNQQCNNDTPCCDGYICEPYGTTSWCCGTAGKRCNNPNCCVGYTCVNATDDTNGVCCVGAVGSTIKAAGTACIRHVECCSAACVDGVCCGNIGAYCTRDAECCGTGVCRANECSCTAQSGRTCSASNKQNPTCCDGYKCQPLGAANYCCGTGGKTCPDPDCCSGYTCSQRKCVPNA